MPHRAPTTARETDARRPAAGVRHRAAGRPRSGWRVPAGLLALVLSASPAFAAATRGAPAPPPDAAATPGPLAGTPAAAAELRPHVATYRVAFKGMQAGDLQLRLARESGDVWRYETRPQPSFLARMVVSASSIERGTFRLTPEGVQPLTYSLDDGTAQRGKEEAQLEYDRAAGRVRGYARGAPVDLELVPGLQDPLSIRAAILVDLLRGSELGRYPMIDGGEVRTYVYRKAGTETLQTAVGTVDTVVYTSAREGADARAKTWRYWYAPSLGWLPVRIQQIDKGQPRLSFEIRSVEFP
jgi:hypothetical protein